MARFATTRWSLFRDARDPETSRRALEEICRAYREPVLAYVRGHGYSSPDAEDLTQEFFTRFLEGRWDAGADQARGHFRALLLVSIRRFLISAEEATHALKRGGAVPRLGFDELAHLQTPERESPERVFQRAWAMAVLDRSYARLRAEAQRAGKTALFDQLSPYLAERPAAEDYQRMSAESGLRANTIAVAVHRLRSRLRELVREELADTCGNADAVETELHELRDTLEHFHD